VNFKVSPCHSRENGWLDLIVLRRDPLVKNREPETPVFAHANARNALFAGQLLYGFHMDAEVLRCLFGCQQRLKPIRGDGWLVPVDSRLWIRPSSAASGGHDLGSIEFINGLHLCYWPFAVAAFMRLQRLWGALGVRLKIP
jgi:hypothetical protein